MLFAIRIFDAAMTSSRIHEIGVVGLQGGMLTHMYILYSIYYHSQNTRLA